MTPPQPDASHDEEAIRRLFGDTFVDWVLATDGDPSRTPEQRRVAALVHEETRELVPDTAEVPGFLRLSRLTQLNPETSRTPLTELRRLAGGSDPMLPEPPDDEVLEALQAWAAENFGGLLLGEGGFSLGWGGKAREQMTRAIVADSSFPFNGEFEPTGELFHITSAGTAAGLHLSTLGTGIVAAAFRQAATLKTRIQFEDLLAELPGALVTAREAFAGNPVQALALAGLSGVLLPEGKQALTVPWGRVRLTHETDNRLLNNQRGITTRALPDGSEIASRATGDLTIETTVPWSAAFTRPTSEDEYDEISSTTSRDLLQRRIQDVRLAFALAMNDPEVPALLPTWAKVDSPITDNVAFTMTEIAGLRQRTPVRLSIEQAEKWEEWIAFLDGLPLENLGHAPQRLLRAITERQDPVDALVDAVIVWEAIFGTHNEITFRVCGSLARLLCHTVEERLSFVKRAREVYTMRSHIVHGASDIKPDKINDSRNEAVRVAIQALRALARDRSDLLAIADSSKRSQRIMLE